MLTSTWEYIPALTEMFVPRFHWESSLGRMGYLSAQSLKRLELVEQLCCGPCGEAAGNYPRLLRRSWKADSLL
jgi:hypothetical protein